MMKTCSEIESLKIEALDVELSGKKILQNFSLELAQGDILCLLGPSGCGKTTALKAIAGLIEVKDGSIQLFDTLIKNNAFELLAEKRNMGFIFQDYALFPHMNIAKNIAFALKGQSSETIETSIRQNLALVHLEGFENRYPHELSGGQQQRSAVARALANRPQLLLMDEPFSNIDSQVKQALMAQLRLLLKENNITCIFVTHNKNEAFAFADKTALMNHGKIDQIDDSQTLFERPNNHFVASFMESGNTLMANTLPHALFKETPMASSDSAMYVLRENGFELNSQEGVSVTVKQSLYIGYRYRNEVDLNGQSLFIESEQALAQQSKLNIQYKYQPHILVDNSEQQKA